MVSFAPLGLDEAYANEIPRLAPWAFFLRHSVASWAVCIPLIPMRSQFLNRQPSAQWTGRPADYPSRSADRRSSVHRQQSFTNSACWVGVRGI